jgi:hypothetical protein
MDRYEIEKKPDYFAQGFRLGLFFGILGALVMLGRDRSPAQTIPELATSAEPTTLPAAETEAEPTITEQPVEIPVPRPIAQG